MTSVWLEGSSTFLEAPLVELFVLQQQCLAVVERLGGQTEPESNDPFDAWEQSLAEEVDEDFDDDPVLHRLFPQAYPDDPRASADFRRYTGPDQKRAKVKELELVISAVDEQLHILTAQGSQLEAEMPIKVAIADPDFEGWLKAFTTIRLTLASELGISDAEDVEQLAELTDDDPRAMQVGTMELAGFYQSLLLAAKYDLT